MFMYIASVKCWILNSCSSLSHLQNEIEYGAEEPPPSPRLQFQQPHSQTGTHSTGTGVPVSSNSFGPAIGGQGVRSVHSDHQAKNSVFSNALSSPVRRSLQHYHLTQGSYSGNNSLPSGNIYRNSDNSNQQGRDPNLPNYNDTSMDMHSDSPDHDSVY